MKIRRSLFGFVKRVSALRGASFGSSCCQAPLLQLYMRTRRRRRRQMDNSRARKRQKRTLPSAICRASFYKKPFINISYLLELFLPPSPPSPPRQHCVTMRVISRHRRLNVLRKRERTRERERETVEKANLNVQTIHEV